MSSPEQSKGKRKAEPKTQLCNACGQMFAKLATHLKMNPWCKQQIEEQGVQEEESLQKRPRPPPAGGKGSKPWDTNANMYANKLRAAIANSRLELHEDMFVSMAHADRAFQQTFQWVDIILNHVLERVRIMTNHEAAVQDAWERTSSVMKEMISWDNVRTTVYKSMQIKPVVPISRSATLVRSRGAQDSRFAHRELAELSIAQLLVQLLQCDEYAREEICRASNTWKTGELHGTLPLEYRDITDGLVFREHAELSRAAVEGEEDDIRIALYLYNDDFTSVNAIGTKRGSHKYSVHLAAIANLPTRVRFKTEYILPILIAQSKLIERAGLNQILCGVNDEGEIVDQFNFASEMRELAKGISISIPDSERGGLRCAPQISIASPRHSPLAYHLTLTSPTPPIASPPTSPSPRPSTPSTLNLTPILSLFA